LNFTLLDKKIKQLPILCIYIMMHLLKVYLK